MKKKSQPLNRSLMPKDYNVSLDKYIGRKNLGGGYIQGETRIPSNYGTKQSMSGFESTYQNIIDYIVRITYKIWEERDVEYISKCYSENSEVFDDYGLQLGNQKIIKDTYHTTGAFSNIKLIADEVIWAGNDEVGYRSSHRTIISGTNDGDSNYGKATKKNIYVLVIANCVSLENDIFLEHVLYNNSALLEQLGFNLQNKVKEMLIHPPAGWPRSEETWQLLRQSNQQNPALYIADPITGFDIDRFCRENFHRLWNEKDMSVLNEYYINNFYFEGATNRKGKGRVDYEKMINEIIKPFSNFSLQVDEVYWMGNEEDGYLVSIRWSAEAVHSYDGIYGPPTAKKVQIWGISQQYIKSNKIIKEWTLFNELDLMMQIEEDRK